MDTKKSTRAVTILAFLLLTVLFGYLIISEVSNIRKVKNEIAVFKNNIIDKKVVLADLRKSKENLDLLEENYDTLSKMIPSSMYEDSIIIEIQNYAQQSNVSLLSVDFLQRIKYENYTEIPLNMSLRGTHTHFISLLNSFLYGERLFKIDSIQLRKDGDGLIINMKAKAFCTTD